jgi:hypothetical protein
MGSWTTPSIDMFSLTTIFPISVLLRLALSASDRIGTAALLNWAIAGRPVRLLAGVRTGWASSKVEGHEWN